MEEAAQEGADDQAEDAVGECSDEANLCILQNTAIYDKNNLRSDYLAQDILFSRLDVMKQQVQETKDQLQLQEGTMSKYKEVQENIVSRDYRYNCIENNAIQGQGGGTGGDDEGGGQPGGAHDAMEEAAGGQHRDQHEQVVAEAGVVDNDLVGAHPVGRGQEGSHDSDGGPGGLGEEGAGEEHDDQERGHDVRHGGVRRDRQQGGEDDGQQQDNSLLKRRKKRAKKQLSGVEPGLVQLKISQFINKFPNLKQGGPMMRLNSNGESVSTGTKIELQ